GISCIFLGTGIRSALVEDHQDVRSELTLDIDDRLGCKAMDGAVYVGPKPNTLLFDLSQPGETEHLISAAVGENGCVPSHKPVQAPGPSNNLDARSEIQMVRVAQEDRSLDFNQLPRREGLYAGLSAHRHERRGMNRAMIGAQYSGTSIVIPALNLILHYCFKLRIFGSKCKALINGGPAPLPAGRADRVPTPTKPRQWRPRLRPENQPCAPGRTSDEFHPAHRTR